MKFKTPEKLQKEIMREINQKRIPGNTKNIIKPLKDRCECGNKVTDHHFLCNSCHAKKQKIKQRNKRKLKGGIKKKCLKN